MENKRADLLQLARDTTSSPGVYLMKDAEGHILYVGKAKNLKNRVVSYFQATRHERLRTEVMVCQVAHFDIILTETEAEALILECTLIKRHKPKFNVSLKDDKTYPYIRIQMNDAFPRLEWTRKVRKDGSRYFGPFPSAWSARQTLTLLNETFKLRDCSDNTFRHRSRPCILFQMGRCSAPCVGKVSENQYRETLQEIVAVLEGKGKELVKSLRKGMKDAAIREEYEEAARYRDQLQNLKIVTEIQGVAEAGSDRNRDVFGLARSETQSHGVVIQVRGGKVIAVKHFDLTNTESSMTDAEVLAAFLEQYYLGGITKRDPLENETGGLPQASEILLPEAPADLDLLERTLGLTIKVPEKPEEEQLIAVARTNAEHSLEQKTKKDKGHGLVSVEDVQKKLHLSKLPYRIECYDISNISGGDAVASRVVFVNGAPDKNLYRRYKIRTVEGSNDFAMMKEVLARRFAKTDEALPDLVVVDGGKGQLSQAVAILEELNVQGVDVVGLAKARTEKDFQSKEVKSSLERIFIPNRKNPISLYSGTPVSNLLTHLRDEAHRFAITYHRKVREKRILGS